MEKFARDVELGNPLTIFLVTKHTDPYKAIDTVAVRNVTVKSLN